MYSPFPLNGVSVSSDGNANGVTTLQCYLPPIDASCVSVSSDGNANGADFNSPYYLHEAVTTLQCYLPLRQAMEAAAASCVKTMPFVSSPPEESPPVSPMSRSLRLGSINEMVASFRNLQLGKFKSFPSSRNVRMGGSSGFGSPGSPEFGSPRGSMRPPGFSGLPSTPTRVPFRSGISYLREEALVMEMQMKSYLKDSNVGAVVGVVTPTDSNVGVGGEVTPNGTANHELSESAMPSESELSESASDREGLVDEQRHMKRGSDEVNPSASLLRPSGPHANANPATAEACVDSKPTEHVQITVGNLHGENTVFVQEHSRPRVTPVQWIFLLNSFGLEIWSAAVDQVSSPGKLNYAIISLCLAIAGVVTCIWELIHGRMKEKDKDASSNSMVYRSLPDIFGLGLAVIQGVWSALQFYFHLQQTSNPVRLSPVALYFYICLVVLKYHWRGGPYEI